MLINIDSANASQLFFYYKFLDKVFQGDIEWDDDKKKVFQVFKYEKIYFQIPCLRLLPCEH